MPELPEVETTAKALRKEVLGLKVLDVWTDLNTADWRKRDTVGNIKYFPYFKKEVIGRKIISAERRAKNILINLSGGKTILIHLKMTGYLFYGASPKIKYAHVVFTLSNKHYLVFSDVRKFGKLTLLSTKEINESKHLRQLGPEPLEKSFSVEKLEAVLAKRKMGKIKTVLMDQTVLAGIGNIYSDEILWSAGVHPERKVESLNKKELKKIWQAMKIILQKGIKFGGDSMSDYLNLYGKKGNFQLHHNAYRRTGEKCRKPGCAGVIIRKVINNRSAHFCSKHQI